MAYEFNQKPTGTFQFQTSDMTTSKTKLAGINATLGSAAVICSGVRTLMLIGGYQPEFEDAIRVRQETVWWNDDEG